MGTQLPWTGAADRTGWRAIRTYRKHRMSTHGGDFSKLAWITAVLCCTAIDSDTVRKVILHLGMTADRTGNAAYMTTGRLMADLDVSRSTVGRARDVAMDLGLMFQTRAARRGGGKNNAAEYRLLMPTPDFECVSPDAFADSECVPPDALNVSSQTHLTGLNVSGGGTPVGTTSLGTALGREAPSRFCADHDETNTTPCHACGVARRASEAWEADRVAAVAAERRRRREVRETCPICEGTNWIPDTEPAVKCRHEAKERTA